jgi:hypothetical protein
MSSATGKFIDITDANREPTTQRDDGENRGDTRESDRPTIGGPEDSRIEAEFIEPASIPIGGIGDTEPRRTKRGTVDRRTKAGRGTEKVSSAVGLEGLSIKDLLIGIHAFGASISGIEELEIDEAEGKKLGDAVEELSRIYGKTISPKTMAWTNFAAALGVVYGPRIMAYRVRMEKEQAMGNTAPKPGPQPVPRNRQDTPPAPGPLPTPSEFYGNESLGAY